MIAPKIIFFGGFEYSLPLLDRLIEAHNAQEISLLPIIAVPSPKPIDRLPVVLQQHLQRQRKTVQNNVVVKRASQHQCAFMVVHAVNSPVFRRWVKKSAADLVFMAGFREILGAELLDVLPPCINFHPSLLPAYRGPRPAFWVLRKGEQETGVTAHRTTPQIDRGDILARLSFKIAPRDTLETVESKLAQAAADLYQPVISVFDTGQQPVANRSDLTPSYYKRPLPQDCTIQADMLMSEAVNILRACGNTFQPYAVINGEQIRLQPLYYAHTPQPGTIAIHLADGTLWVRA